MVTLEIDHTFQIKQEEVAYILSGGRRDLNLTKNILSVIDNYKSQLEAIIVPKAIYRVLPVEKLPERKYFEGVDEVAIVICTIGPILPSEVNVLLERDDPYNGSILDSIGSVAAEELADLVNILLIEKQKLLDTQVSTRYSPGYCTVPITDQKIIFDNLDGSSIGVKLTEGYLMSPIKSVSFFLNIGPNMNSSRWEKRCQFCGKVCSYRREPKLDSVDHNL